MARQRTPGLTTREAQILHVLWGQGPCTVAQIRRELPEPPTTNTVRKLLSIMNQRQLVADDGRAYGKLYRAAVEMDDSRSQALQQLVTTLYDGCAGDVVADLLRARLVTSAQLRKMAGAASGDGGRQAPG